MILNSLHLYKMTGGIKHNQHYTTHYCHPLSTRHNLESMISCPNKTEGRRSREICHILAIEGAFSRILFSFSFSQEIIDDPSSRKTVEEEPVTTYCNNGCQGACACPALDFQSTLPTSEPAVSAPSALIQNPSTDDGPPTDPLPEIPNFESQSSLPRKGSSKNPLQFIKDKFSRHDSLDARTEASGNERRGSKNQGGRRRWSLLGRRNSGSEKEMHLRKDETNKEVTKGESKKDVNKDGSTKEVNKGGSNEEVKNGGSNMEVNTDGGNKEVSKDGSNAEMSGIDDIRSESVHHAQRCKDSLRLLKGMMNFKRTNSTCSTAE